MVPSVISEKISSGLIELRTDIGLVYAKPSFCERIYLLWTFRNFRRLPAQVLNRRQRKLIGRLCQATALSQHGTTVTSRIIGVVENVHLMPDRKTEVAANTSKIVEMRTTNTHVGMARAVGSEEIPSPLTRLTYSRTGTRRFSRSAANVKTISALRRDSARQSETQKTNRVLVNSDVGGMWTQHGLKWALVAAFAAGLFGTLFYFRYEAPAPPIMVHSPSSRGVPASAIPQPVPVQAQRSMPSKHTQPDAINAATQPPSPAITARQHGSKQGNVVIVPEPPTVTIDSTAAERVLIAAAPERLIYPVAPSPVSTGRVSLKVVIGTDGAVKEVDVLSGNRALAGAAVRAVSNWRYRPRELNGHAVEAETNITISFVGDDAISISFLH